MGDGTTVDVTITGMVNPCVLFKAADFGLGLTGLELSYPDWSLTGPPGAQDRRACSGTSLTTSRPHRSSCSAIPSAFSDSAGP